MFVYRIKGIKNIKNISLQRVIYKLYIRIANDCNSPFFFKLIVDLWQQVSSIIIQRSERTAKLQSTSNTLKKYVVVDKLSMA